ncbi:MAG: hypothetical protein AB7W59_01380 [Acidimicrobiia bacterium]
MVETHTMHRRARTGIAVTAAATAAMALALSSAPLGAATRDESDCPASSGTDVLYFSNRTDRSNPQPLDGATIAKGSRPAIFVVTSGNDDTGTSDVRFHLDQIDDGLRDCSLGPKIEHEGLYVTAPDPAPGYLYDFNGGTTRKANAYSTSPLNKAVHTITVIRTYPSGDPQDPINERVVQATFTIG